MVWLAIRMVQKNRVRDWHRIDDNIPTELPNGVGEWRCMHVSPAGEDELRALRHRLALTVLEYFRQKSVMVTP